METLTVQSEEAELLEDLAVILTRAKARNQKRIRGQRIVIGVIIFVLVPSLIGAALSRNLLLRIMVDIALVSFVMGTITFDHLRTTKGVYGFNERDLAQLSAINDKRVLKVLLGVPFITANKNISSLRDDLLKHWLPLLTDRDTHLYNETEKGNLTVLLQSSKDEQALLIFRALELIGDADQLSYIKLWRLRQSGMRAKPKTLVAYKSCLAAIEARAALSRSDSQLLRPSFSNDKADTYLRPVTQKIDEKADTLLRADLTPQPPLPIPSSLGEEGENHEETVSDDVEKSKP